MYFSHNFYMLLTKDIFTSSRRKKKMFLLKEKKYWWLVCKMHKNTTKIITTHRPLHNQHITLLIHDCVWRVVLISYLRARHIDSESKVITLFINIFQKSSMDFIRKIKRNEKQPRSLPTCDCYDFLYMQILYITSNRWKY